MANKHIFTGLTPANLDANGVDGSPGVTLGVNWYSDEDGLVLGSRFYLGNRNYDNQQITGGIYNADTGVLLAQKNIVITSSMAIGWQNIPFDQPLFIERNQEYISAVYFPCDTSADGKGHYVFSSSFFTGNDGYDNPPLHAQKNDLILDRRNGLFHYGDSSIHFPSGNYQGGNYFIDIDFGTYVAVPVYDQATSAWKNHPLKHRENGVWKY